MQFPAALSVQTNSTEAKNVYVGVIPSEVVDARMVLVRVTETGSATYESAVITHADWNTAARTDQEITSVPVDPNNPGELYVAISEAYGAAGPGLVMKSTDGAGETWSIFRSGSSIQKVKDVAMHAGTIYMATGYDDAGQQSASDFIHFGASATGGGMGHAWMCYHPDCIETTRGYFSRACHWEDVSKINLLMDSHTSIPYYAVYSNTPDQLKAMTFMYLDGFYLAETRFGVFYQYPATGHGGLEGMIMVFDPKCAPFAPRVDEDNTVFETEDDNLIRVKLFSPGLPETMDGFYASTISADTVSLADEFKNEITYDFTRVMVDADDDGLPDDWETANGFDPSNGADPASPGKRLYRVKARIP